MAARTHLLLTTVRQPMHQLGARAARLLFDRIDGRDRCPSCCARQWSSVRAAAAHTINYLKTRGNDHESHNPEPSSSRCTRRLGDRSRQHRRPCGLAAPAAPEGDITVWAMGAEGDNLGVLADAFMEEFPDVSVEVTAVPWDAAHDKIVTAIAGGEVPDVSLIGTTWMGEFATLGGLEPTPDTIDPAQFFEGAWNTTVVDGVSYGVPWYVETRLIYYRTDLAEEGGFNQAPATWDELTQLAQAMVDGGAEWGISLQHRAAPGRGRRSCRSSGRPAARSSTTRTTSRSTPRRASRR